MPRGAVSDEVNERARVLLCQYMDGEIDHKEHNQGEVAGKWGVAQGTISSLAGRGRRGARQRFTSDRIRQLAKLLNMPEWQITGEREPTPTSMQRDVILAFLVRLGVQKGLAEVVLEEPDRWKIDDVAHCNRRNAALSPAEWRDRLDRTAGLDSKAPPPASEIAGPKSERVLPMRRRPGRLGPEQDR